MADLTSIEKMKLESAFQMEGGYVLDFTNRTFQEFMQENAGIDINDQKYSHHSGSKANRMRAYWVKEPNKAVGKIIAKLVEYRREKALIVNQLFTHQEEALLSDCLKISERLTGIAKASPTPIKKSQDKAKKKQELLSQFDELGMVSEPSERRKRGNKLELLLQDAFELHGIETRNRFVRNGGGEQIDGAFILDGWFYIVECKWIGKLSDIRQLDSLYGKLNRSGKQTMGLFLSINGWSEHVVNLLKQNQDKSIILMDGYDFRCILDGSTNIPLELLLKNKISHLNFDGEPFYSIGALINK